MSTEFDPYHKWLGIPRAEQPPNHYRLLALNVFESDPDVIEAGADARTAHLRSLQTGKFGDLTQPLLNAVTSARLCLLKPDRKAAYDAELRSRIAAPKSAAAAEATGTETVADCPAVAMTAETQLTTAGSQLLDFISADQAGGNVSDLSSASSSGRKSRARAITAGRATNWPKVFVIFGPIAGILAVAAAITIHNAQEADSNDDSAGTNISHSPNSGAFTPHVPTTSPKKLAGANSPKTAAVAIAHTEEAHAPNKPAASSGKPWESAAFQQWMKAVVSLPAEQQAAAVAKKLQELNPGFDGKETHKIENDVVSELQFLTVNVTDISPVRALPRLTSLICHGSEGQGVLSDITPLAGVKLTNLDIGFSKVADLSSLKGMPLTELQFWGAQVKDMTALTGMPLNFLNCGANPVDDLSPLRGMALARIWCLNTRVSDLTPLKGMPLSQLDIQSCPVTDLSPLKGLPLGQLMCNDVPAADLSPLAGMELTIFNFTPKNITTGINIVRQMKSITLIGLGWGDRPRFSPDEFWKKYDAGEFGKPGSSEVPVVATQPQANDPSSSTTTTGSGIQKIVAVKEGIERILDPNLNPGQLAKVDDLFLHNRPRVRNSVVEVQHIAELIIAFRKVDSADVDKLNAALDAAQQKAHNFTDPKDQRVRVRPGEENIEFSLNNARNLEQDLQSIKEELKGIAVPSTERDRIPQDPPAHTEGFTSMFNGKDLTGWDGLEGFWSVKDGAICGTETKRHPSPQTFLIYKTPFRDFEIHYKYKFRTPAGNSGLQFRSKILDSQQHRVGGYQADFVTGLDYDGTGSIVDEASVAGGRGMMSNSGEKTVWDRKNQRHNGKLPGSVDPKSFLKTGDWNDVVLVAKGNHITYTINGQLMNDLTDNSPQALRAGVIALELCKGVTMEVQFKDIEIKDLSPSASASINQTK